MGVALRSTTKTTPRFFARKHFVNTSLSPGKLIDNQYRVRIPNGPERVYAAKMASRNAYDMHRIVYDLHRKFGSEMATESSRKIDKNTPLTL